MISERSGKLERTVDTVFASRDIWSWPTFSSKGVKLKGCIALGRFRGREVGRGLAGAKVLARNCLGGVAALAILALSACGGSVAVSDGHAPDAAAPDVHEASDGAADAGSACPSSYPPDSSASVISCCNGQLCRGKCTADGGCSCFGIAGGCWKGTVCCQLSFACTGVKTCG